MARVTVDKENHLPVDIHYEDRGSGRPVVLIHGWPLSVGQWEFQVPGLLAAGHRVVTYDGRGFGASAKPRGGYDPDTLAADLHMLLEHLDLREATLVGFSSGACTAVRYLSRFGNQRISRLALVSAAGPYLRRTGAHPEGFLEDSKLREYQRCLTDDRVSFLHRFATKFFEIAGTPASRPTMPQPLHTRVIMLAAAASHRGMTESLGQAATTDFRNDLRAITVPTLVVHGEADALLPVESTGALVAEAVSDCRLVRMQGAPHGLIVTRAAEFNRELMAFLEG
ncbi:alpha/beta hydrolase [Catenulispora sp. NF23]|uniref:Alpha/beta hydrolase n=1 Tax=Catenulispora pinistramenti TaxID=2705254 RepID=A0ABS5KML4_9ACTN|nr:alpha/beta hydrolase [Catenulispora pinistramenti]MBS2537673.1 alpha/beta hydrolase [Catenulispora pinistramenti]MBS2547240.1 alpha/beta hydrolase [Catenulispora pinistramenti]